MLRRLAGYLRPLRLFGIFHARLLGFAAAGAAPLLRRLLRPHRPLPAPTASRPLRVCHVTCSFDVGGTQRQIMNLCLSNDDPAFIHSAVESFPEQNFLYRRDVRIDPRNYRGTTPWGRFLGRAVLDPGLRSQQLVQVYKLHRDFRRLRPDVVVGWGHEMAMLAFVAAAAARVPRIAFAIRTWNPGFGWSPIPHLLRRAHRRMATLADLILVNGSPLRSDYAAWAGIPAARIRVCPNGIDPAARPSSLDFAVDSAHDPALDSARDFSPDAISRAEIRAKLGIPASALVLMTMGRFSPEKGQLVFLRAYERLGRSAPPDAAIPYAVLCGDGPTLAPARAFASARGLDRALFPGRVDDVHAWLAAADIFVMPSDFEGMPNALMEAMAAGLPSVSTRRSGALDVAREGVDALYVDVGDVAAMATALARLAADPSARLRIGDSARARLLDFSVAAMVRRFNDLMRRAARNKGFRQFPGISGCSGSAAGLIFF